MIILPPKTPARIDGYEWDAENHTVRLHYAGHIQRLALLQGPLPGHD